ncbi:hypothetical protein ACFDWB_004961 [Salmonella enterica]|nr:hypothetical protein [Salmonella enterica subsp. enterica serovar Anecho]
MEMFSYAISPIDFDWVLAPKVSPLIERLKDEVDKLNLEFGQDEFLRNFEELETSDGLNNIRSIMRMYDGYQMALRYAREAGWEGDHVEPPRYFVIPAESDFYIGFTFKQENSGVTFVISPIPLPHLEPITF